jgi:uncharacterized protein DUF4386
MDWRMDRQRWGGVGGLLYGAVFVGAFALRVAVYSGAHLNGARDLEDPARLLPAIAHQPLGFVAIAGMKLLTGVAVLLIVLALYERLASLAISLVRPATAVGILSVGAFAAQGIFEMIRLPLIAADYARHPAAAAAAFRTYDTVDSVLLSLTMITLGAWIAIICWTIIRARVFSRALGWLGLVWGALTLLSPVEDTSFSLIGLVLGPIWAIWLGVILLRPSPADGDAAPSGATPDSAVPGAAEGAQ